MNESKTILLVDDDESYAECNRDLLEAYGYEVHYAPNGTKGVEAAMQLRPHLMILDLMMRTDTEGVDVARKISGIPELHNMGVLMVTGLPYVLQQAGIDQPYEESLPVDGVLEKPIPPGRLIEEVERVLAENTGESKK